MRASLARSTIFLLLAALVPLACSGGNSGPACVLDDPGSCKGDKVCAAITTMKVGCFPPVRLQGNVSDLLEGTPIEGALVVAVDANGSPLTSSAATDTAGDYVLSIPVTRNPDGSPSVDFVTLVVTAPDYAKFPSPPRSALPVDASTAVKDADGWLIENATTDVGLVPLPGAPIGSTVTGSVDQALGGLSVIAVQGGVAVSTGITEADGSFTLFNVPDGATDFFALKAGIATDVVGATVSGGLSGLGLPVSSAAMGTVTGTVSYANAPNGDASSVILAPTATWDPVFLTGEAPSGLRANISKSSNTFSIAEVPPGDYVVLAAYENDLLVRDPDESIGGTAILEVTVTAGMTVDAGGFKITDALAVLSPGASGLEVISTATPTFSWADDSSEDGYELDVLDAFGNVVLTTDLPSHSGSGNPSFTWPGPPLTDGMIYQFRVLSFRDTVSGRAYISATENLLGAFQVQAAP